MLKAIRGLGTNVNPGPTVFDLEVLHHKDYLQPVHSLQLFPQAVKHGFAD